MALAALNKVETRRDVAERLMVLNVKHAALFSEIDDLTEKLKVFAETEGEGFTEEFGDGRHIKVSKPSESKFKGLMPVLDAAAFLRLSDKQRGKLIDGAVISMDEQYTQARRPSVSVKAT